MFAHYVWSTWQREPRIDAEWETRLYGCIAAKCKELGSLWVIVGGMPDHLHVLLRLPPMVGYALVAKEIKGSSSYLLNHELARGTGFRWQGGYFARTVDPDNLDPVREYVRNQKQHHAMGNTVAEWERLAGE